MPSPFAFALGFLVAIFFAPMMTRWAALLGAVLGKHGGDFLGAPKRRLVWAAPLAMVIHPAPFLVAAVLAGGAMAGLGLLGRSWEWFFAGLYSYLACAGVLVSRVLRRSRARRTDRWTG